MNSCAKWLEDHGYGSLVHTESLAGGCINDVRRIHLDSGQTLVLKQNSHAPHDMFSAEAAGLQALAEADACRVPEVIHAEPGFILLEDLGSGNATTDYFASLGRQLAILHKHEGPQFGFTVDNYCGATPQCNINDSDGHHFFGEHRILALARKSQQQGLLSTQDLARAESIAGNLSRWIPQMPATLIHGDLWSGNVHCDEEGQPALIDPASYWGWAEAELAMTDLFGGFPAIFYQAYESESGIAADWRDRAALYNLYHLLNHLLLFGSSYHASVVSILDRYKD